MKTPITYSLLCMALLAAAQYPARGAEESALPAATPLSRQEAVLVTVTASVEAIDYTNREVTLKGPLGNTVTFVVDQRVQRLNEVNVGDLVQADYYMSVAGEVREPTPDEDKEPIVLLEGKAKAGPAESPAAGVMRQFRAVTTIEGLDRPTKTLTLKGPRGNYLTVRVADPSRLTQVRIGDHIVVTYTEAVAISLQKISKKTTE